jgi:hypothetical protein
VSLVAFGLQACGDSVTQVGEADVVELRVTPSEGSLGVGRTLQMRALPLDASSALISGLTVAWTSSDPTIATIDDSGLASGLADGVVELTASIAGLTATSTVTVAPPPSIAFSTSSVSFSAVAGSTDERVDTVSITNGGSFTLEGLSIDSVRYDAGPQTDWLLAELTNSTAPASLVLTAALTGLNTAGDYAATVWVAGLDADNSPAALAVSLVIESGDAAALTVNDGDGQTGVVDEPLAVAPSVRVEDAFGNAVSGEQVTFAVTSGGGSITNPVVTSDSVGVARVGSWTLGTVAGENTLTASLAGATSIVITATGGAGGADALELAAGDGQTATAGSDVTVPPAVRVRDAFGNLVEGASVSFSPIDGGGSVTGSPAASGADGVAEVGSWKLGPIAGPNELVATAAGVADTIRFTATGIAGAAAVLSVASGDAQADTIGATLGAPLAVKVADLGGNGV